jgi:HK97 family phage prohead protease
MNVLERRFFTPTSIRAIRAADPALSAGMVTGYASTWHSTSSDLGQFVERCAPGCFARSIAKGDDVFALVGHNPDLVVGRSKNHSLRLKEDSTGLYHECDVAATSVGRDLVELVRRGDLSEMSFAFTVDPDGEDWSEIDDPNEDDRSQCRRVKLRTLKSVRLHDVSYTPYPAYSGTSVSAQPTVHISSSSRSFDSYFPHGIPAEIRSRVPDVRERFEQLRTRQEREAQARRRSLTHLVLGI